ncbi:MAG: cysteine-rich CWC family protein [Halioglobus sp.]
MNTTASGSELICPLCGKNNRCAVTRGAPVEACWCRDTPIAASALAAVPTEMIGKACLCPACAQTKGDSPID